MRATPQVACGRNTWTSPAPPPAASAANRSTSDVTFVTRRPRVSTSNSSDVIPASVLCAGTDALSLERIARVSTPDLCAEACVDLSRGVRHGGVVALVGPVDPTGDEHC